MTVGFKELVLLMFPSELICLTFTAPSLYSPSGKTKLLPLPVIHGPLLTEYCQVALGFSPLTIMEPLLVIKSVLLMPVSAAR